LAAKFTNSGANLTKVVLNVSNMSCSGCISTIKGALAGYPGIKDVLVDISSGKTEVYFNRAELKDVSEIEKAITDSGYPARIMKTFTPEDLRNERDMAASKAEYYIASVSGYDIARADFTKELNAARQRVRKAYGDGILETAQGQTLDNRLKAQVASRLIDEGILLQEIKKSGYELNKDKLNSELKKHIKNSGKNGNEFQQSIRDDGYDYDYFKKRFETRLLINRYLDEKVLAGASNPYEKQRMFASWFKNSQLLAEVVYYDKDLENAARNSSASGSCCAAK
jgi:copper chaperone CopZ